MFLLTDIKQTRVYQEAKQEGETQLLLSLLSKRFGAMGSRCIQAINQLSLEQLEDLGEALLDFGNVAELNHWLKSRVTE
jgi:predicted transposase YdaD